MLALNRDQRGPKERHLTGLARTGLFLFRADSADALDGKRRPAGSRGPVRECSRVRASYETCLTSPLSGIQERET